MGINSQLSFHQAFQAVQEAFGIQLSHEQKRVIEYNHRSPILVNACAGSGKTTLLMFDVFMLILTGEAKPQQILGITFSRAARKNMQDKYKAVRDNLISNGYPISSDVVPSFRTFHSLFLKILKQFSKYKNSKIITSHTHFQSKLSKKLNFRVNRNSKNYRIGKAFQAYNYLLNQDISYDGININPKYLPTLYRKGFFIKNNQISPYGYNPLFRNKSLFKQQTSNVLDYVILVTSYNKLKDYYNCIDFQDMKYDLSAALKDRRSCNFVRTIMSKFTYCFIDEYQDIDNVQNNIMKKILTPEALNHSSVIGDDDQSIYSFRGSRPNLIINYTKDVPNAKRFQLSTNYRTDDKALDTVKPLINENKFRIRKSLKSANTSKGGLMEIINTPKKRKKTKKQPIGDHKAPISKDKKTYNNSGIALLHDALLRTQQADTDAPHIAILTRLNVYKEIAIDFLANHHIYVKSNKLLQHTYFYRTLTMIMKALIKNDTRYILPYLNKVGFSHYKSHFISVYRKYRRFHNNLYRLARTAVKADKEFYHAHGFALKKKQRGYVENDIQSDEAIVEGIKKVRKDDSGKHVFLATFQLMNNYLDYMSQKDYLAPDTFPTISWVKHNINKYKKATDWFKEESKKLKRIKEAKHNKTYSHEITVMTIHQSKGLQFDYVYLYGLTKSRLNDGYMNMNYLFSPDVSKIDFLNTLLQLPNNQIMSIDHGNGSKHFDQNGFSYEVDKFDNRSYLLMNYYNLALALGQLVNTITRYCVKRASKNGDSKHWSQMRVFLVGQLLFQIASGEDVMNIALPDNNYRNSRLNLIHNAFEYNYIHARKVSAYVEEERRLVYVAITRAKYYAIFNVTKYPKPSPLIDELHIDRKNVFYEKNGSLVHAFLTKADRRAKLRKKMYKLQKEMNLLK